MIGVTQSTYSKYESVDGSVLPSFETLVLLAEALGVPLGALAGLEPPGEAPLLKVKPPPKWVADLLPDLETLPQAGREAVRALVKGYRR